MLRVPARFNRGGKMTRELSARFTGCRPVFPVTDLDASLSYYIGVLGFTLDWLWPAVENSENPGTSVRTAYLYRDDFELLVRSESSPVTPVEVVVGVPSTEGVDAIHEEYLDAGAEILERPFFRDWGSYEMRVVDPDGHLLRILH